MRHILLCVPLISGCTLFNGKPQQGPWEPTTPKPVFSDYATDDARAVTGELTTSSGGLITATDAKGITYELSVPPNAVASDVTLTLTPISSLASLPAGLTWTLGVDIQPHGILFLQEPTLTVTFPSARDVKSLSGVGLYPAKGRSGRAMLGHMALDVSDGTGGMITVFIPTPETGAYGAADGNPDPLGRPETRQQQAHHDIADSIRRSMDTFEPNYDELTRIHEGWRRGIEYELQLENADLEALIREATDWARSARRIGADDGWEELLGKLLKRLLDRRLAECRDPQMGVFAARQMMGIIRSLGMIGLTDPEFDEQRLIEKYAKCLTFEFRMTSKFIYRTMATIVVERSAKFMLTLQPALDGPLMVVRGDGPVTLVGTPTWTDANGTCSETFESATNTTFRVLEVDLNYNLDASPLQSATVRVFPEPGEAAELFRFVCPMSNTLSEVEASRYWQGGFTEHYVPDQLATPKPGMVIKAWAPGQAPIYVTKDYDRTKHPTTDKSIQEISHYEIEHKPRM